MLLFSIFSSRLSLLLNVAFFSASHIFFSSALQVKVGSDIPFEINGSGYNQCEHVQEFACNNDICDVCAGSATDGRCRNGSNDTTCAIGTLCNIPDAGHCLENTWCTPGKHTMPTLGTPKHFRCVSVRGLDAEQALVIYSNNDWTGDTCFIDGNGVWSTPNEDEANSIDVVQRGTGNFKSCYFSGGNADGEQKKIPTLPGTTTQQGAAAQQSDSAGQGSCINPDGADPGDSGVCVNLAQKFPDVSDTFYYSNGDSTASGGDRRRRSRILLKRVDEFRAPNARDIAATNGILAYFQQGLSNGLPAGNLEVVDQSHGTTLRDFMTGNSQQAWAGDHIMELQLIKQFFNTAQGAVFRVVLNQMLNCVTTNSIVIDAVNNACNLIGVAVRINGLKGRLFRVNNNGQPSNVDFALNYRGELLALVNYMSYLQPNFLDIVRRVGNIMDVVWHQNNGAQGQQPSGLWSQYANAAWQGTLDRLNGALNGNTVYKEQALFSQDYANANLRT